MFTSPGQYPYPLIHWHICPLHQVDEEVTKIMWKAVLICIQMALDAGVLVHGSDILGHRGTAERTCGSWTCLIQQSLINCPDMSILLVEGVLVAFTSFVRGSANYWKGVWRNWGIWKDWELLSHTKWSLNNDKYHLHTTFWFSELQFGFQARTSQLQSQRHFDNKAPLFQWLWFLSNLQSNSCSEIDF
jgi:hypothetical protein